MQVESVGHWQAMSRQHQKSSLGIERARGHTYRVPALAAVELAVERVKAADEVVAGDLSWYGAGWLGERVADAVGVYDAKVALLWPSC